MAGTNSEGLIEKRRVLVGELWVKGNSIRAITAELQKQEEFKELSKNTVNNDLKIIKGRLIAENTGKVEEMRARSVEVFRRAQKDAWEAIEKYPGPFREKASYLRVIADCEEKIAKLQGTFAPVQMGLTDREGKPLRIIFELAKTDKGAEVGAQD
jgi:hypothetical protein